MQKEKTLNLALKAPYIGILGQSSIFQNAKFLRAQFRTKNVLLGYFWGATLKLLSCLKSALLNSTK